MEFGLFTKISKYLTYIFLSYLFIGAILLPFILKPQLEKIINSELNAKVNIESLSFNPLIFELTIDNFVLNDLNRNRLASFKSLRINVDPTTLFMGAVKLKELSLIDPKIYVIYKKDKSINLLKIMKEDKVKTSKAQKNKDASVNVPRIIIDKIEMRGGELSYSDYTKKKNFSIGLENIGFILENFDTKKIKQESAGLRFYSRLSDGGFVDLKSKITSLEPFKIEGSIDFEASKLYTEWKYMQDELQLEVADGKVSFSTEYFFNLADINATKIENFHISLDNLRIKPKNKNQDILTLETMYIADATVLPMQQYVDIGKLGLHGLHIRVKRYKDKVVDWVQYLQVKVSESQVNKKEQKVKTKNEAKEAISWNVALHTLSLEKIALEFKDEAIRPNVITKIDELDIFANDITLEGEKPFNYNLTIQLNEKARCQARGTLRHQKLKLFTQINCKDFDIVHYRPYIRKVAYENLQKYDASLDSAYLDFNVDFSLIDKNSSLVTVVKDTNFSVRNLLLSKRSTKEQLLHFKEFNVDNISLNSQTKELNISKVAFDRLIANFARQKNGQLNVDKVVIAKATKKIEKKVKKVQSVENPYRVRVKEVRLNNGSLFFVDKAVKKVQKQKIDRVYIALEDIDSKSKTWFNYRASLRVNTKGKIKAKGKVQHTPLKQKGSIVANKLSLAALTPYLQESSYLSIDDGFLSFMFNESYIPSKKSPDLQLTGSLKLNSLFTSNSNDNNSVLFSLNELEVKPFTLELFPNRLYVDNVLVDSFYVSAKIDENKTLNFAKLLKETSQDNQVDGNRSIKKEAQEPIFPITVVKLDVKNGSAEFQDFSLPIKFRTNIHDVQGVLYALSNTPGDTSYLDIDGEVDKYGSTKLKGSVDGFNPKEYTDLDFNFKNLDLHAMSGYSASFAGYEIEAGKLYLDLGYDIMYGELHATNNIMIKHIKLGRELEGENINHLPLGFVIGLLEDSNGIINIDMPIEGNVNEPDFKYGILVRNTLANLIAKAVTSPFKFLGAAMGIDGDELEYIAFEFGKSNITPPEREKLDKIVQVMQKRPKLTLEVDGTYDTVYDLQALKLQKLVLMVMKKSGDENTQGRTALTVEVLEEIYADMKGSAAVENLKTKLQEIYGDKIAVYKREYQKVLIGLCTQTQQVSVMELEKLGENRANTIKSYLVNEQNLETDRVKIGRLIKVDKADKKELRVKLNIEVQSEDK